MTQLSPHFSLAEMTRSQTATRRGIDNSAPIAVMPDLRRLANRLERVRGLCGMQPVFISSGYRSPDLNTLIGGSRKSRHMLGQAADFVIPGAGDAFEVCHRIQSTGIEFDQLIYEGSWVHLSIEPAGVTARRHVMTAQFKRGERTQYIEGLHYV